MQSSLNYIKYQGKTKKQITIKSEPYTRDYLPYDFYSLDFIGNVTIDTSIERPDIELNVIDEIVSSVEVDENIKDEIVIETIQLVSQDYEFEDSLKIDNVEESKSQEDFDEFYEARLIYIINKSKTDSVRIEFIEDSFFMIQEAKDENGFWKPIEYVWPSWCGVSYNHNFLLPQEIIIAKILKYSGEFNTDLRLKLNIYGHIFYSKPFSGWINKEQFIKPDISNRKAGSHLSDEKFYEFIFLDF